MLKMIDLSISSLIGSQNMYHSVINQSEKVWERQIFPGVNPCKYENHVFESNILHSWSLKMRDKK